MAYEPLEDGELAALVTYLEMRDAPTKPARSGVFRLHRLEHPDTDEYRRLYRLVGARWLWFSRLLRDDLSLSQIIHDPLVHIFSVVDPSASDVGLVELDFREAGQCELVFIGLIPELAGKGHGKWLLDSAVQLAWRDGVTRVHVHTCSLDHPAALAAYRRAGFTPYERAIERFRDPRLLGILPKECAPQIPLLGTPG